MDTNLTKSLTDLIDETLSELEELRKSRFSAAEISMAASGDTKIGGQPANGKLDKQEDEKDEEEKDEDEDDMDKGENETADPNAGHHKPIAGEGDKHGQGPRELTGGGKVRGTEGKNSSADPGEIHKADDEDEEDEKHPGKDETKAKAKSIEEDAKDIKKLHKSLQTSESLMKSYVEERVRPLEDKITTILELVNKIAEQPVAPKGATARGGGMPLFKSEDAGEPLHKAVVASKLFELKKSGTRVDSLDIAKAEMGQDLMQIAKKYQLS